LQENNSGKWFCGFDLAEPTPNYTVFGKMRQRIGTSRLSKMFGDLRDQLKTQGYMNEVFSFQDKLQAVSHAFLSQKIQKTC